MYELSTVCQILSKCVLAVLVHGSKSHRPIDAKEPRFLTSTPNAKFSLRDIRCATLSRYLFLTCYREEEKKMKTRNKKKEAGKMSYLLKIVWNTKCNNRSYNTGWFNVDKSDK